MRLIEGDWNEECTKLTLTDGREVLEHDGVDHRDNPTKVLVKLTKKLKKLGEKTHELVEIADGSDCIWYGIVKVQE